MRLTVLEDIRIATPCNADWQDMSGDDRVRFCGKCDKNVYNLSAMTRGEAEELVRQKEGRLCVRLYQRADGTVLSADCPVGVRRKRLRQRVWASLSGAAASLMLVLGVWTGRARADLALNDGKKNPPVHHPVMMGAVAVAPSPAPVVLKMGEPMAMPLMGSMSAPKTKK
jgi:hypothetical protein